MPLLLHLTPLLLRVWKTLHSLLNGGVLVAWWSGLGMLAWGRKRYLLLSEVQPDPPATERLPALSIVVPACNEAETVEKAMGSLLALDYPAVEIIAVDDRSTDTTGAILDRLAARNPRLRVIHIACLPEGWLGKNHAMQVASEEATGEWLLFTDADVVYAPDALRRAVAYADRRGLDHLVLAPYCETHGFWERLFLSYFTLMYTFRVRIWDISNPKSSAYAGFGAFNLVRAAAYRKCGGHAALPMETVDDMKLGKVLKRNGFRAELLRGTDLLSVRWMVGLRGVVNGLTKNAFAAYDFRLDRMLGSIVGIAITGIYPVVGLLLPCAPARWLAAGTLLAMILGAGATRRANGAGAAYGLAYPLAALVLIYIILRSTWWTYRRNGIIWRGTRYPLDALRRGIV